MRTGWQDRTRRWLCGAGLLMGSTAALAHDSWLVADKYKAKPGTTVRLAFVTADRFPISDHATDPQRVHSWNVRRQDRSEPIRTYAVDGQELVARSALETTGLYIFAVALRSRFIELSPEDFEHYLRDEHAESALAFRRSKGDTSQPGREDYTKLAKTFVQVGNAVDQDRSYAKPVGHPLEIIPLSHPGTWKVGDQVEVKVLWNGEPAVGRWVSSGHEGLAPHTFVHAVKTDSHGKARFKIDVPGLWFLRTHIIRPVQHAEVENKENAKKADWQSFWASITFRIAARVSE